MGVPHCSNQYVQFLQDLIKVTPPADLDCANLQKALKTIKETATRIDENLQNKQNLDVIREIEKKFMGRVVAIRARMR